MKTPITDKCSDYPRDFLPSDKVIHADLARRLELDRAALMEAVADYLNPFACRQKTHEKLMAAFASARANFPKP